MLTRYVNTASAGGGDGTTNDIAGASAAYPTIQTALSALQQDLTAETPQDVDVAEYQHKSIALQIICDKAGGDDAEGVETVAEVGWVLDATHRILVRAADNSRHDALKRHTGYRVRLNDTTSRAIQIINEANAAFLSLDGIQFDAQGAGWENAVGVSGSTSPPTDWMEVVACIFTQDGNAPACEYQSGARFITTRFTGGTQGTARAGGWQNEFFGCIADNNAGFGFGNDSSATPGGRVFKNCVAFNNGGEDFESAGDYTGAENNASEDLTAPGTNSITGLTSDAFVDFANENLHPANDGALDDAGKDLVTAGDLVAGQDGDAEGTSRGTAWSIGPLETVESDPTGVGNGSLALRLTVAGEKHAVGVA